MRSPRGDQRAVCVVQRRRLCFSLRVVAFAVVEELTRDPMRGSHGAKMMAEVLRCMSQLESLLMDQAVRTCSQDRHVNRNDAHSGFTGTPKIDVQRTDGFTWR